MSTSVLVKTEITMPTPEEIAARAAQLAAQVQEARGSSNLFGEESLPEGMVLREPQVMRKAAFDANNPDTWAATVQRNAPCPCGSGKKFKQCHGKLA